VSDRPVGGRDGEMVSMATAFTSLCSYNSGQMYSSKSSRISLIRRSFAVTPVFSLYSGFFWLSFSWALFLLCLIERKGCDCNLHVFEVIFNELLYREIKILSSFSTHANIIIIYQILAYG